MKKTAMVLLGLAFSTGALAKEPILTAHVSAEGAVLRQSSQWIEHVQRTVQNNYLTEYKLTLNEQVVDTDPGFCTVSPIDISTEVTTLHGQAKVIGKPIVESVVVMTQLVDMKEPSGDNSLEFLVMCTR
ncbi:hypothetical protein ACQKPE_19355 [Pseudomonas sp. NPDC089554]|uniref:hypothetical protein n=1 Tax=Pseudomonas sp. NPDC089554 TaxID=3390653 RepID=UPI003CFCAB85